MNLSKLLTLSLAACMVVDAQSGLGPINVSAAEATDGWTLLFDGRTLDGWHTFNGAGVDPRWSVKNGELVLAPSATGIISGADLETNESFEDFDLSIEWMMSPKGNSGIMYRVHAEGHEHPWDAGPEYQLLDNGSVDDPAIHQAGAVWDLYAPARDVTKPIGEFNHTRIVVKKNHVEHWMNGVKILDYVLGSEDFEARRAKSAYKDNKNFGSLTKGTIVLQDEGRLMRFRNIKVRRLD